MKPTFLIIGTQKGGTSAGIFYLNQHNDIYMYEGEPHYFDFDDNYNKGDKWYENKFFNDKKPYVHKKERGDKTPINCFFPKAMDRIKKYDPNIKLIIFLRHPIGRAFSQYNHIKQISNTSSSQYSPTKRMYRSNNPTFRKIIEHDMKKKNYH